jgi:DNA-binding GntR family transcriptional regulator
MAKVEGTQAAETISDAELAELEKRYLETRAALREARAAYEAADREFEDAYTLFLRKGLERARA